MYRSFVSLGEHTPKYFILIVAMVNGIVSLISLSVFSFLVYRNATDFCVLILYLATVRPETMKPLEENIGKTHLDINHSKILYDPPLNIMEIKVKINKWGLIKLKRFWTMKETISKVKRQPSEWEKIITNKTTDKRLI